MYQRFQEGEDKPSNMFLKIQKKWLYIKKKKWNIYFKTFLNIKTKIMLVIFKTWMSIWYCLFI